MVARLSTFQSDVRAVLLTGLSTASSAVITAASSVLAALGQLQAQVSLRAPLASPPLSGVPTAPTVAPTALAGSTQLATTAFVRTGTTAADNALSGQVGEYLSASLALGSAVSLTSGTAANIITLSLSAGDWDVCANGVFSLSSSVQISISTVGISSTSASIPAITSNTQSTAVTHNQVVTTSYNLLVGSCRFSVGSSTTLYLVMQGSFSGTMSGCGTIWARRMR